MIKKIGLVLMMVSVLTLSLPASVVMATEPPTTVEVNLGAAISLAPAESRLDIPVDIKDIVVRTAENATGLAAFDFTFTWDPSVIDVDAVTTNFAGAAAFGGFPTIGAINHGGGTVNVAATGTANPTADLTILDIDIHAVGDPGDSCVLGVIVTDLADDKAPIHGLQIPNRSINATVEIPLGTLTSIAVLPSAPTIFLGQDQQFDAAATYTGGTVNVTDTATWDSSDHSVATIDGNGLATSVGEGTTDITASLDGTTSTPVRTLTVSTGAVASIELSPATANITADETQAYSTMAFNTYGGSWNVTATTAYSINSSAAGSWASNVYTPGIISPLGVPWTVTANLSGQGDTANLTVTEGVADQIVISTITPSITADETATFTAQATDRGTNPLGDITANTTFEIVEASHGGSWADNVYTAAKTGTWTVRGTHTPTGKTDTETLTVTAGALASISISTTTPIINTAQTATFTSTAYDADSNSWDGTSSTNFTIEAGAQGSWADNVYTPQKVGTWEVTGNLSGSIDTANLTVEGGPVDHIIISPTMPNITADETQAFSVLAVDGVGENWTVSLSTFTAFSINTTAGGNWTDNVYTAEKISPPGTPWIVTATYSGTTVGGIPKTDTASLNVTAGALDHIIVSPSTQTITADNTQTYTVLAYDQHDNSRGDVSTTTTFTIDAGALGSFALNVYTAEKVGTWTVTANYSDKLDTAALTVTKGALDHIELSPSSATITADDTQTYTSAAFDADANSWDVTAGTIFSISAGAGGSWAANIYTAETVRITEGYDYWTVTGNHTASGEGDTAQLKVLPGAAYRIVVAPTTANVTAGETTDFTAESYDQHDNDRTLSGDITATATWSSSNPGRASIQSKGESNPGRATGYSPGTVTITATQTGVSGTASLTVKAATVSSIEVTPVAATITVGSTQEFLAIATYSDGSKRDVTSIASWTSDNESIATVGTNGIATAHATNTGTVVITAELDGAPPDTSTLDVINEPLLSIDVTSPAGSVNAGETQQYKAMGDYNGTSVNLTDVVLWESTNTAVAIIRPGGLATTYTTGTVNITATFDGISGNKTLTVDPAIIESVAVTPSNATITHVSGNDPTLQYTATTIYSDGTITDNTSDAAWIISAGAGATVNPATGLVTATGVGTPTVEATVGVVPGDTGLTILADTVAPVVSLTRPSDGFTSSSVNVTVIGSVDDTSATTRGNTEIVVTYPGGGVPATIDVAPDPDVNGDFSQIVTLQAGSNTILVKATDDDGNIGRSGTKTVRVDPVKPTITITSPVEGLVTNVALVTVEGNTGSAASATLRLNGSSVATVSGAFSPSVTLTEGKNAIIVSGYAPGGSTDAFLGTSGVRTVTLDTTAPEVKINSPAPGSLFNTARITVTGTIDDPLVTTANLTVGGAVQPPVPVVNGSFTQDITLVAGSNIITVSATDSLGTTGSATPVTVTLDTAAPRVTVTQPVNNLLTNVGGQVVAGTVDDPSSDLTLNVNGSSQTIALLPDGSFSQLVSLTTGANTITVSAFDGVNTGNSGIINVTLDVTAPDIKIALGDPTDSVIITVTSNEALAATPTISGIAVTMTPTGVNEWTGRFQSIVAGTSYTATASGTDAAGNPDTASATFSTEPVTTVGNAASVTNDSTRLEITTDTAVTGQTISVTSHTENPAAKAPVADTDAGVFIEIIASGNLTDSIASIDIQVDYDEDDVAARGIDEATLKLYVVSEATGAWEAVPGSASNVTGNYIYGTVTHLSKYGAFGTPTVSAPTPGTDLGGLPPSAPAPEPGVTDVSDVVTSEGVFTQDVTAESDDGKVELDIQKDVIGLTEEGEALSEISIFEVAQPPAPPAAASIIGLTYDIGPDDATFDPPITLTLTYDPEALPAGVTESTLTIAYWDSTQWVSLESTVDTTANTVTAEVSHLSKYAVIGRIFTPPTPPAVPEPAAFTTSGLMVSPSEVNVGETVTITVSVANTGGTEGTYATILNINGVKEAEKSVTVDAGDSKIVTFSVTKQEPGSYSVAVDGLSASFTVVAPPVAPPVVPPVEPPVEPPVTPVNWGLIGGIIAAVIVIGLLVYFLWWRRRI